MCAGCVSGSITGYVLKKIKEKTSSYCGSKLATIGISAASGYVGGNVYTVYSTVTGIMPQHVSDYLDSYLFVPSILFVSSLLFVYNVNFCTFFVLNCFMKHIPPSTSCAPSNTSAHSPPHCSRFKKCPAAPCRPTIPSWEDTETQLEYKMKKFWNEKMGGGCNRL